MIDAALNFANYAFSFIFILSFIVFIHEFGHYYVAKKAGVKVEAFAIGFGPELFGWNDRAQTRWKICIIPLGGYVKMFGDLDPASAPDNDKLKEMTEEEQKVAFHSKPLAAKAAIVAAGPIANFILAIVILTGFFYHYGKPITLPLISSIVEESAADEGGLKPGDLITAIDGSSIESFSQLQRNVALNVGTPITLDITRDKQSITLSVTPYISDSKDIFGNDVKTPMLGVQSEVTDYKQLSFIESVQQSFSETYFICSGTLRALGQMVTGQRDLSDISGPIGIAKYSGQASNKGIRTVLWFIVILSINLGLINLFPIPVLDGGHLLYYAIEAIQGKPLADRVQDIGLKIGIFLLASLMIFAVINDILKFIK